ncbi:MAG: MopE-related protein, partial [Polyangiaceae bacterium]
SSDPEAGVADPDGGGVLPGDDSSTPASDAGLTDTNMDDACATLSCGTGQTCSTGVCVVDADGDGFPPPADCNDHDATVHPSAAETCNNVDDNCDGKIDEGFDLDLDTYFTCAHGALAIDCNDNDATIHPGAVEVCNAKDDDCNAKIDELPAHPATSDQFSPVNAHWAAPGDALINDVAGWARLTEAANNKSGALWWNASYTFDHFDMSTTIWMQNTGSGADGMTFAWVPGTNVTAIGGGGGGYGFTGLGGFAVAIDTYQNSGDPGAPFLTIVNSANTRLITAAIPNVRDGANHTLRVQLQSPNITVSIDGTVYVNNFAIPGYAPFAGHWGFTAATGGSAESHYVGTISMSFPDGQGCVL